MLPCGTPQSTGDLSDWAPVNTTLCVWSSMTDLVHERTVPWMSKSFCRRLIKKRINHVKRSRQIEKTEQWNFAFVSSRIEVRYELEYCCHHQMVMTICGLLHGNKIILLKKGYDLAADQSLYNFWHELVGYWSIVFHISGITSAFFSASAWWLHGAYWQVGIQVEKDRAKDRALGYATRNVREGDVKPDARTEKERDDKFITMYRQCPNQDDRQWRIEWSMYVCMYVTFITRHMTF